MEYFQARLFLAYLTMTILMETPVLFVLVRFAFGQSNEQLSTRRVLATGALASFTTYPYLWYVFPALMTDPAQALVIGELLICLIEAMVIFGMLRLPFRRALVASLVCNLTTIVFGNLMNRLIVYYRWFL